MDNQYTVYVVDDVEASRRIVESTLGQFYKVETFESGDACIARMAEKLPELFLLDVDMPGMDGYTLCRRIRSEAASSQVPVIFISGLDDLESRLAGYDAGGDDFIIKPFKFAELKQKVEVLRRIGEEKSSLRLRLEETDMLATMVLSNLDEYAVLVKCLRALNGCEGYRDIAETTLGMLKAYHLEGVLQFRLPENELTMNQAGLAGPLEVSIINQVRTLGTIEEFRNRTVFNYSRVSILVNNMPVADSDLCGRLRDHLAIAVETVDGKLLAMLTEQQSTATRGEIASLLQALTATVHAFGDKYEKARYQGSEKTRQMLADLDSAFSSLGLREEHEDRIKSIVESRADELINIFDFSAETEKTFSDLSLRLGQTLEPTNRK